MAIVRDVPFFGSPNVALPFLSSVHVLRILARQWARSRSRTVSAIASPIRTPIYARKRTSNACVVRRVVRPCLDSLNHFRVFAVTSRLCGELFDFGNGQDTISSYLTLLGVITLSITFSAR